MIVDTVDRRTVRTALELAAHAPSVHNSQPWRWRIGDRSVHLYADLRRWLPATDAEGRDLLVSLGAVLHHLRVALAAAGLRGTVHRFPNPGLPGLVAAVELFPGPAAEADLALAAAVEARRSDRRRYSSWEVPPAVLAELVGHAADQGAILRPVSAAGARSRIEAAIAAAAAAHEETPGYRTETALWTGRSASDDGIPAANLLRRAPVEDTNRHFPAGTIEQVDLDEPDGALLAVLGTASDDQLSQLRAGEALSAVVLHATVAGLASCPLSEMLEVESTRTALREEVLGGALAPQLVLRIGWAPPIPLPATPRRPVDSTVDGVRSSTR